MPIVKSTSIQLLFATHFVGGKLKTVELFLLGHYRSYELLMIHRVDRILLHGGVDTSTEESGNVGLQDHK